MECGRLPNELIFVGIGFKLTTVQENSIETDSKLFHDCLDNADKNRGYAVLQ